MDLPLNWSKHSCHAANSSSSKYLNGHHLSLWRKFNVAFKARGNNVRPANQVSLRELHGIAAPIAQSQRGKLPRLCVWYFLVWRFCLKSSNFTLYKVLPRTLELRMCTQAKMGVLIWGTHLYVSYTWKHVVGQHAYTKTENWVERYCIALTTLRKCDTPDMPIGSSPVPVKPHPCPSKPHPLHEALPTTWSAILGKGC